MHYENYQGKINEELLGIKDYRSTFFIKVYAEKLNLKNPFFLQARLGTPFSIAKEVAMYINSYDSHKNIIYIEKGIDELCLAVNKDPMLKEILGSTWSYQENTLQKNKQMIERDSVIKINIILNKIMEEMDDYESKIIEKLKDIVFGDCDLAQRKRLYDQIDLYTGMYISLLIDKEFSYTYLYHRLKYLTQKSNYKKGLNFEQQFDVVFNKLSFEKLEYEVYFRINKINGINYVKKEFNKENIIIITNIENYILIKFPKNQDEGEIRKNYIKISVIASDYLAAVFLAKKILDKNLDLILYSYKVDMDIDDICVVYNDARMAKVIKEVDVKKELKKMYVEDSLYSSKNDVYHFSSVIDKLAPTDKRQINQSFRYMRLTRRTLSNEQKIINLWISLESLFHWKNGTKILTILSNYVPKFYSHLSLNGRLDLALKFIKSIKVEIDGLDKDIDQKKLVNIFLHNEELSIKIYENISDEVKKYRFRKIYETFKDIRSINNQIQSTEADVEKQIRRIYFLRNKITHTGFYSDINPILSIHLMDYIQMCYSIIYNGLTEYKVLEERKASFFDIFTMKLFEYDENKYKYEKSKIFELPIMVD